MNNTKNLDLSGNEVRVMDKEMFCPPVALTGDSEYKPTFDTVRLAGHEYGFKVQLSKQDLDNLSQDLTGIVNHALGNDNDLINEYYYKLGLQIDFHGQIAWHAISNHKPLETTADNFNNKLKNRLRDLYPKIPQKSLNHLNIAVCDYLRRIERQAESGSYM
jgi:hypothetical protein